MSPGSPDIVLVDAGGANIASVRFALQRLGLDAPLTADPARIRAADRVILPGVGAAGAAMRRLRELGLVELLRSLEQPVAGVCLGLQLLFESSTEGEDGRPAGSPTECLGLVPGEVRAMTPAPGVRVPHMGWNVLAAGPALDGPAGQDEAGRRVAALLRGAGAGAPAGAGGAEPRAYFVHSYAAEVSEHTLAMTTHGAPFAAMVRHGDVWGMQFHPERSGSLGAGLLAAFCGVPGPTPGSDGAR